MSIPDLGWRSITALFRRVFGDRAGSIAPLFAMLLLPTVLAAGGAVDVARAISSRNDLQEAVDATALGLSHLSPSTPVATLQADAQTWITAELAGKSFGTYSITVTPSNGQLDISVTASAPTMVLGLAGISQLPVTAHSTVVWGSGYVEVSLVLDNTGSMADPLGSSSTTKIAALQTAADSMVDQLSAAATYTAIPGIVKMAVVPYTMTVNVGSTYQNASWISPGLPSTYGADEFSTAGTNRFTLFSQMGLTWGGCVESRPSPYDVTESPPTTSNTATLYVPYFAPDEPGSTKGSSTWNNQTWYNNYLSDASSSTTWSTLQGNVSKYNTKTFINSGTSPIGYQYGPNAGCQIQPLIRLTTNFAAVKATIDAMTVGGDTDIKAGVEWGWHTLSPNAPFADGVAYGTAQHTKVMVLMTDGQNHNVVTSNNDASVYSGIGYIWQNRIGTTSSSLTTRVSVLDQKLGQACTNVKAAGIVMYVVVLVDPTVDQSTVEGCATSSDKLFLVTDTNQLTGVFSNIAGSIQRLRITK